MNSCKTNGASAICIMKFSLYLMFLDVLQQAALWISNDPWFNSDPISYVVWIHTIKNRNEVSKCFLLFLVSVFGCIQKSYHKQPEGICFNNQNAYEILFLFVLENDREEAHTTINSSHILLEKRNNDERSKRPTMITLW